MPGRAGPCRDSPWTSRSSKRTRIGAAKRQLSAHAPATRHRERRPVEEQATSRALLRVGDGCTSQQGVQGRYTHSQKKSIMVTAVSTPVTPAH